VDRIDKHLTDAKEKKKKLPAHRGLYKPNNFSLAFVAPLRRIGGSNVLLTLRGFNSLGIYYVVWLPLVFSHLFDILAFPLIPQAR
jgi:hypothetical protein